MTARTFILDGMEHDVGAALCGCNRAIGALKKARGER